MWVEVQRHFGSIYLGTLQNAPATLHSIREGDTVRFKAEHVLDIEGLDDPTSSLWKKFLGLGAVALLGYLAWKAYKARQASLQASATSSAFAAPVLTLSTLEPPTPATFEAPALEALNPPQGAHRP